MKMRLHMWELKANYGRQNLDNRCLMCQAEADTTEHALECNKGDKKFNLNDERGKEWREITEMYRKKKKDRSIGNIGEEQNIVEEQKKIEEKRRQQKKTKAKGKSVMRIHNKFIGEHPCRSAISIKLLKFKFIDFIELTLRHGFSPVNLMQIFKTPFLKNTSGRLLLKIVELVEQNRSYQAHVFLEMFKILCIFQKCLSSVVNVLTNSAKISDLTRGEVFQFNLSKNDEKIG